MIFERSSDAVLLAEPEFAVWTFEPDAGLVSSFLDEQGDLSAVERFAQFHEDVCEPLQGRYYSALMPAQPPGPGQQLAFDVDLDRCSGCKACVAACHNLNGLDEGESWRDVGLVVGGMAELPIIQHVTSGCHHCLEPACSNACPVDAYEKDPHTGIVRHLDDQCIGCQYCTLACPYDAPKYNANRGIVRKCDMCRDRLAVGEAPACVQACPHEAIRIRVVDRAGVIGRARAGDFLATMPDPGHTLPTTHFRTSHLIGPAGLQPLDDHHLEPEHAHWPLIAMLVLTQLSVGGFAVEMAGFLAGVSLGSSAIVHTILSLGIGWAGLGASVLHLGRPLYAYRALIGLRHSWLSREVLAFGLFAKIAAVYAVLVVLFPNWLEAVPGTRPVLLGLVIATGLAGVACSVMVYHAVRRPYWKAAFGGSKFAGTSLVLGLATTLAALGIASLSPDSDILGWHAAFWRLPVVAGCLIAASIGKISYELVLIQRFSRSDLRALRQTSALHRGPLRRVMGLRCLLGLVGGAVLPAMVVISSGMMIPTATAVCAVLALAVSIGGEIAERYLFFTAVTHPGRLEG